LSVNQFILFALFLAQTGEPPWWLTIDRCTRDPDRGRFQDWRYLTANPFHRQINHGGRNVGTFSIRLMDEHGRPVSDRKITIHYGFMRGVGSEYTDDDGWAEFPTNGYSDVRTILADTLITSRSVELSSSKVIYDGAKFSYVIQNG
jgi:hypothetical protein